MSIFKFKAITGHSVTIITKSGAYVNLVETRGAVALHYAAYHNKAEAVQCLLQHEADASIKDDLSETPLETALRMKSIGSGTVLYESAKTSVETIPTRKLNFRASLRSIPIEVTLEDLSTTPDVRTMLRTRLKISFRIS